jgi:hypothetical protein
MILLMNLLTLPMNLLTLLMKRGLVMGLLRTSLMRMPLDQ